MKTTNSQESIGGGMVRVRGCRVCAGGEGWRGGGKGGGGERGRGRDRGRGVNTN